MRGLVMTGGLHCSAMRRVARRELKRGASTEQELLLMISVFGTILLFAVLVVAFKTLFTGGLGPILQSLAGALPSA